MTIKRVLLMSLAICTVAFAFAPVTQAAISLDRTRIVFPADLQSMNLHVFNKDQVTPYLAKAWLEDSKGEKLNDKSAFIVTPSEQNIEPKSQMQLNIQAMPTARELPQDKETSVGHIRSAGEGRAHRFRLGIKSCGLASTGLIALSSSSARS